MSVKEYTKEFEKLLIKCDPQVAEDQTIVMYLGGLDPRYANVVDNKAASTRWRYSKSKSSPTRTRLIYWALSP